MLANASTHSVPSMRQTHRESRTMSQRLYIVWLSEYLEPARGAAGLLRFGVCECVFVVVLRLRGMAVASNHGRASSIKAPTIRVPEDVGEANCRMHRWEANWST